MTISIYDAKILASQVMRDTEANGGAATSEVIPDGVSNAIFPDITLLDRANGRTRTRKVFPSIQSDNNEVALGAHCIIARLPGDEKIKLRLYECNDWFGSIAGEADTVLAEASPTTPAAPAYMGKTTAAGFELHGNHTSGVLSLKLIHKSTVDAPLEGDYLSLSYGANEQFVKVLSVKTKVYKYGDLYTVGSAYACSVYAGAAQGAWRFAVYGTAPAGGEVIGIGLSTKVQFCKVVSAYSETHVLPHTALELGEDGFYHSVTSYESVTLTYLILDQPIGYGLLGFTDLGSITPAASVLFHASAIDYTWIEQTIVEIDAPLVADFPGISPTWPAPTNHDDPFGGAGLDITPAPTLIYYAEEVAAAAAVYDVDLVASASTVLTVSAATGDTVLSVANASSFRAGDDVELRRVVQFSDNYTSNTSTNLHLTKLFAITVKAGNGRALASALWSVNSETGIITWNNLGGVAMPLTVTATIADRCKISRVSGVSQVRLDTALAHDYPAGAALSRYLALTQIVKPHCATQRLTASKAIGDTTLSIADTSIFAAGDLVVVLNDLVATGTYTSNTTTNLGRTDCDNITIEDLGKTRLDPAKYSANFTTGVITWGDLTGVSQPLTIAARHEDTATVLEVTSNTVLTLNYALTHDYADTVSLVAKALELGDLTAYVSAPFEQLAWTGAWSDSIIGSNTQFQFDHIHNPITVTNKGAIQERWAVIFDTGANTFHVIGEHVGQIVTAAPVGSDCEPANPAGGLYFSLPAAGWGGGRSAGNVLRFNTYAANHPVRISQEIVPGAQTSSDYQFCLEFRYSVDV